MRLGSLVIFFGPAYASVDIRSRWLISASGNSLRIIGRIASAAGVVFFGLFSQIGDYRITLIISGALFLPAAVVACFLPEREEAG